MSRRRIVRRARVSVLTFVLVSVLARLMIPSLWAWSVESNSHEEALQQALRETAREGEEVALKEELWNKWKEKDDTPRIREHPEIVERLQSVK